MKSVAPNHSISGASSVKYDTEIVGTPSGASKTWYPLRTACQKTSPAAARNTTSR